MATVIKVKIEDHEGVGLFYLRMILRQEFQRLCIILMSVTKFLGRS
jgi:hypothetical protein